MANLFRLRELGFALPAGTHVLSAETATALAGATHVLTTADAHAAAIVEDARREREQERARGLAEGLAEADARAFERLAAEAITLDRALASLEDDLVRLVTSCVASLIDGLDEQEKARAIVRGALRRLRDERRVELRAPPPLAERIESLRDELRREWPDLRVIEVIADDSLAGTYVIAQGSTGRVHVDLSGRVENLPAILRAAAVGAAVAPP